jgi:hypothetical protein
LPSDGDATEDRGGVCAVCVCVCVCVREREREEGRMCAVCV